MLLFCRSPVFYFSSFHSTPKRKMMNAIHVLGVTAIAWQLYIMNANAVVKEDAVDREIRLEFEAKMKQAEALEAKQA